jgi:putative FmdB family regulatory protein
MPLYDFACDKCGKKDEFYLSTSDKPAPECCGQSMTRLYGMGSLRIEMGYPKWIDRIDEIHKRQADRGERLTLPHPREVQAT